MFDSVTCSACITFCMHNFHLGCMTPPCSTENKWCYCASFDDIIFLTSTELAQRFAYVTQQIRIQFLSKHLTCYIRHFFTGLTIGNYITYQHIILHLLRFLIICCFELNFSLLLQMCVNIKMKRKITKSA